LVGRPQSGPNCRQEHARRTDALYQDALLFSDQYDLGIEYRGWAPDFDSVVFRGDPARREFLAFWLVDGRVAAAMNANVWNHGEDLETLVRSAQRVDARGLTDPAIDLAHVAESG
jgi:3-phenylpropionate/trans-cinnamate dioxygenase ferredoxin reductase subunit